MNSRIYNGLRAALAPFGIHLGTLAANDRPTPQVNAYLSQVQASQVQAPFQVYSASVTLAIAGTDWHPQTILDALGTFIPLEDREPGDATTDNTAYFSLLPPPTIESTSLTMDPETGIPHTTFSLNFNLQP